MLSSLLQTSTHDWLIIGGNGSIGSELIHSLQRLRRPDPPHPIITRTHSHDEYAKTSLSLLNQYPRERPLRVIFSGGKGGFSLSQESAWQQHQAFQDFCQRLISLNRLEKVILISSLGAHCSDVSSPYRQLVMSKEQSLLHYLDGRHLILRLPSMYGWNRHAERHHGLIGVMLRHLRLRRTTDIYARMETRRNYLSMNLLAPLLLRAGTGCSLVDRTGILNIQASVNLSIFDVCRSFFRSTRLRPAVRLMRPSHVDAEHHYPTLLDDDKMIVNDQIEAWIKWQWQQTARSFQS